jgi:hypothetical protein
MTYFVERVFFGAAGRKSPCIALKVLETCEVWRSYHPRAVNSFQNRERLGGATKPGGISTLSTLSSLVPLNEKVI